MKHPRFWGVFTTCLLALCGWLCIGQTATPLESSGFARYLTTNSTSASFTISAGRTVTAPSNMVTLGAVPGRRFRGAEIVFYGAGSATNTFDYRVYVVEKNSGSNPSGQPDDYDVQLFCYGTATLGSTAGVGTKGPTSSDKLVDTLTVTTSELCKAVYPAYSAPAPLVFSPGSNGEARLFIPDFGNASDFFIEFDMTGATSANAMIKKGT